MAKQAKLTQPLKWVGGKHYMAKHIINLFPKHLHYVEPYFGGGSVLLQRDPEGVSEVVNDTDGELTNFWQILRGPLSFAEFKRQVDAIPLSRVEFNMTRVASGKACTVSEAVDFFVRARQSRAGDQKAFTSLTRTRTRRGMNGNVSEWLGAVDGLPEVHARLRRVVIENLPALDVIRREDTPNTLFYLDPTYLPETRATKKLYRHEMTYEDHVDLLKAIHRLMGSVILSGYPSDLYKEMLEDKGWRYVDFDIANHQAGGDSKRRMVERCWMNY